MPTRINQGSKRIRRIRKMVGKSYKRNFRKIINDLFKKFIAIKVSKQLFTFSIKIAWVLILALKIFKFFGY